MLPFDWTFLVMITRKEIRHSVEFLSVTAVFYVNQGEDGSKHLSYLWA